MDPPQLAENTPAECASQADCSICEVIKAKGRNNDEWNLHQVFHSPCNACSEMEVPEAKMCQFCQHLRLTHLSFCVPAQDIPEKIFIPEPHWESECPLCRFFIRLSRREQAPEQLPRWEEQLEFPLFLLATEWRGQQVQWHVGGSDGWNTPVEFLVVQNASQPLPVFQEIRSELGDLRSCVSRCVEEHELCSNPADAVFPDCFRLIDIEERRILSPAVINSIEFVALSYVWGESNNTDCSTVSNIAERSKFLDASTLPATIKDAINICKMLGERYIWIDRLCILQDDDKDKLSQIHAMTSIYTAAKFVIIDASSSNMDDGIPGISLARRPQISESIAGLNINVQLPPLWDAVGPSSWNARGWTYQEAILPKRKIFFTKSQIFYECAVRIDHEETLAYSSFIRSMHEKVRYPTTTTSCRYNATSDCREDLDKTKLLWREAETSWEAYRRHVPRFYSRTLRYASDNVNAFLGIIDALYLTGNSYHGLPFPDFDMALLWKHYGAFSSPKSPKKNFTNSDVSPSCFPSWSWASSSEAPLEYDRLHEDFCASLCLWFQPAAEEVHGIKPIMAVSQAVRWPDDKPGIFHRRIDNNATREVLFKAISSSMIESPIRIDAKSWNTQSSSELSENLANRWPSYAAFWQDVYGQEKSIQDAAMRLQNEVNGKTRDGVLITRTQIASIVIKDARANEDDLPLWYTVEFTIHNLQGEPIADIVDDRGRQIRKRFEEGAESFTCVALSISAREVNEKDDSVEAEDRSKLEPWVNAMIVRRHDGYCYCIGLAKVQLDHWINLDRTFETIVLA